MVSASVSGPNGLCECVTIETCRVGVSCRVGALTSRWHGLPMNK